MSEDNEAEKAATEYANGYGHGVTIPKRMHKDICDGISLVRHIAFLAGQADFIKHRLPKLLEMAREGVGTEVEYNDYMYSYADLLAMAEKGEV